MEVQVEQVQKAYGGPQATSDVDTNLSLDQGNPRSNQPTLLAF
jgi:hypothetical protein